MFLQFAAALDTVATNVCVIARSIAGGRLRRGLRSVVVRDSLGHIMSVMDQVRLEVGVEMLRHVSKAVCASSVLLVLPALSEFVAWVHLSQLFRGDELGRRVRVKVGTELVLDMDGHFSDLRPLSRHQLHGSHSF